MTDKRDKKIKHYNAIVTIDPYNGKSYKFQHSEIKLHKLSGFKKDNFYISTISSKNLITDSIEISRNIADEDLESAIDIQVYDELNFDPAVQYTIFYKEFFGFESNSKRKFNIFAIETNKIEEEFKDIIKKVKYIDYILPEPLLIKSVYNKNLIEKDSVDCFLYFKKSDAFLAIYADGEYIYSKSLNYSLERMHEKFCEISGESYQYEDFINFILTGYSTNISIENQRLIIKLYKEMFVYINDIIFYAKRAYMIENINRIYINSSIGIFKNIDRYIRTYIDIEPHELNFVIAKNAKEIKCDQLHNLMILAAMDYIEDPDDGLNFSIFKRPPPFRQRPIGKIFYIILLSIIISMAYPIYEFGYAYFIKLKLINLRKEEHKLYVEASSIKKQLSRLQKQQDIVQKKLDKEFLKLSFREKLLNQIYSKKVHYPMKVKLLVEIFQKINKYKTKIYDIQIGTEKNGLMFMTFSVFSRRDKNITELIKSLTKMKKYSVKTKEIRRDTKKQIYLSNIKVVLNGNI